MSINTLKLAFSISTTASMNSKDRQILRVLQSNGRITNQDLAEQVNLSPSPCLRRVRNLEESGAIRGYNADVDPAVYGMSVTVFVRVRLERHNAADVQRFESRIMLINEVLECHILTGATDYQLKVVVPDLDAYEGFIRQHIHPIGGISSIETSFVYGTVKRTAVFPLID